MKVALGGDHAGFVYKQQLVQFLKSEGYDVKDYGPSSDDSVDYPDYVHPLATGVSNKEHELGILICGSANGVAMAANKHKDIRAAIAWQEELAKLSRQHNNANILCLPARFISYEEAQKITLAFLKEAFEGGRHERRVNKIPC